MSQPKEDWFTRYIFKPFFVFSAVQMVVKGITKTITDYSLGNLLLTILCVVLTITTVHIFYYREYPDE